MSHVAPIRPAPVPKPIPVLFRMDSGRDRRLVAFFPTLPINKYDKLFRALLQWDWGWQEHCSDREGLHRNRPASPEEYAAALEDLAAEFAKPVWQPAVGGKGPFELTACHRITKAHDRMAAERQRQLERLNTC